MARLAAAFGTSHSVMLAATLQDWLTGFRETDPRMPYYDAQGKRCSFDDLLARAPANAEEHITAALITRRFHEVQEAMQRMKTEIASAKLDALVIVGDDQYELFQDDHMPADEVDIQADSGDHMPGRLGPLIGSQLDKTYLRLDGNGLEQV